MVDVDHPDVRRAPNEPRLAPAVDTSARHATCCYLGMELRSLGSAMWAEPRDVSASRESCVT